MTAVVAVSDASLSESHEVSTSHNHVLIMVITYQVLSEAMGEDHKWQSGDHGTLQCHNCNSVAKRPNHDPVTL